MISTFPRSARGFTLPELIISMGIMTIVGLMIFLVLNSGMVLYAKNTAVNTAHQQARAGVDQMLQNIHSSVSIPQLVDSNLQPITTIIDGSGNPVQAPGISFQSFAAGPFPVVADALATDTSSHPELPGLRAGRRSAAQHPRLRH